MLRIVESGRGVTLALGGGGARGLAHLGVLQVLEREQIPVAGIGGTSMGAIVGALVARLGSADQATEAVRSFVRSPAFRGVPFRRFGADEGGGHILAGLGRRLRKSFVIAVGLQRTSIADEGLRDRPLHELFGQARIEDLKIPFLCLAADLRSGERVQFDRGPAVEALKASSSLVGVFPPVVVGERWLVDGGCVSPVPVVEVVERFGGPVIGVPLPQDLAGRRAVESVLNVLVRESWIKDRSQMEAQMRYADLAVHPAIGDVYWNEFDRLDECVAAGRAAAEVALPEIRRLARRLSSPWRWIRRYRPRCPRDEIGRRPIGGPA